MTQRETDPQRRECLGGGAEGVGREAGVKGREGYAYWRTKCYKQPVLLGRTLVYDNPYFLLHLPTPQTQITGICPHNQNI